MVKLLRLSILLAGIAASPVALAQEPSPSHLAAARDVMEVTKVLAPVDDLLLAFGEQIRKQNVTRPELTKDLDQVLTSLAPELVLQRQQITNTVAKTYAKWLTEPELKEVAAFYRTPVGEKFNKVQPDLVDEVVGDVQRWTPEASEYFMVRVRAEMLKRGHTLQ